MAYDTENARPEEIEREIEQDRRRIGERLDEIQNRMSPGQLVDEALAYAKSSGGGEFLSNLAGSMKTNPVPVALMGISLAWLMASRNSGTAADSHEADDVDYPLATVAGPVRRVGPVEQDQNGRFSHFADATGQRFKAMTDTTGRRAGHFVDQTGQTYRGFRDSAGRQINDIRDEAGTLFDEASGWLSDTWRHVSHATAKAGRHVSEAGRSAGKSSMDMGSSLFEQTQRMNDTILRQFKDQPLIGGALAFAVGAAIGAALPRTEQEDEVLGEMADRVKDQVGHQAASAMDKAEHLASDAYRRATQVAADVHDAARDRLTEETRHLRGTDTAPTRPH
ncbi:YtxH domain-containing protein [Rhizobium oryzicola]|uniref:YtxH domain-containing protein n=1 Tax=Rhizobium oryzicola TaxID=1232668 RepID=A0ABT8SSC1_9HYPH|nr:YtxH domain-containing protein [Rhizobium oryzicola]MDO1580627.1 YtxH domain-containing protein [Rhizobium oryzicola]